MFIIDVIPISKGFGESGLSYFHAKDIPKGAVVSAPLGSKEINAIVINSKNVRDHKLELKKSGFSMKKINRVIAASSPYSQEFFEVANQMSLMYATTPGEILDALISKKLIDENILTAEKPRLARPSKNFNEILIEGTFKKRLEFYKDKTIKALHNNSSVLILSPTTHKSDIIRKSLEKNDVKPVFILHSSLAKKSLLQNTKGLLENTGPVVMVGTPMILPFVREDVGLMILEDSESGGYRTLKKPYLNLTHAAEELALRKQIELLKGDIFHGTQARWKAQEKGSTIKTEGLSSARIEVADMREDEDKKNPEVFVSAELKEEVEALKQGEKMFIYVPRRGLAGITTCNDCGQTVLCNKCSSPVVPHKGKEKNIFVCHACREERSAHETCKNCASWNLKSLGLGIEGLKKDLGAIFPKVPIYEISHDAAATSKKIKEVLKNFESTGGILLGTQKSLSHLPQIKTSVIASFDSLLATSSHSLREEIMRLALFLIEHTKENLLIQSRDPEAELINIIRNKDTDSLIEKELQDRKEFEYPPFNILIKISIPKKQTELYSKVLTHVGKHNPITYESLPSRTSKLPLNIILLKIDPKNWPDKNLHALLSGLPPIVKTEINPRSIF